jgi:hypothetical protein
MFSIVCYDPSSKDDISDDLEIASERIRWLNDHVGNGQWFQEFSWDDERSSWVRWYHLDCPPGLAIMFKLTWGGQ